MKGHAIGFRETLRAAVAGFKAGWLKDRTYVDQYTPKRTLIEQIKFRVMTYLMGVNQDTLLFFMKDQFTIAEVELLITSMPAGIGPLMIQRVQISKDPPPQTSPNGEQIEAVEIQPEMVKMETR